jgi:hypothetical protein
VPAPTQWDVILGLIAIALAGTDAVTMLAAVIVGHTSQRASGWAQRLDDMIFDCGFPLDVLAVIFALAAGLAGRRGRRLAVVAVGLVFLSFVLMFAS